MRQAKVIFWCGILLLWNFPAYSQEWREDVDLDEIVQDLIQQDGEADYNQLYEVMFQYLRNPINLNKATADDLKSLYILSDRQINNLINYREKYGDFISIYELQAVPGLNLPEIYDLLYFSDIYERSMNVGSEPFLTRLINEENNSLIYRIETILEDERGYMPIDADGNRIERSTWDKLTNKNPYDTSSYLGGPLRHLIRYRVGHKNDFRLGFNITKDPGEQFTWDPETKRYGFDFYSFHFVKYNMGKIKALALGDYQLQFGQGLVMAGGFAPPKSAEATGTLRRSNTGVRPYTSTVENNYLRGASVTVEATKNIDATIFGSYNQVDGSIQEIDPEEEDFVQNAVDAGVSLNTINVTSVTSSGYHRTRSQLAKKRLVDQTVVGGNASYISDNKRLKAGATFVNTSFSEDFQPSDRTYNIMQFSGRSNSTYGVNYSYNWENFNFFGEFAQSSSGGIGLVNGFSSFLSQKVEYAILFRHFDPNFHSFFSNGFSESSRNSNETGIYWGLKIKLNRKWTFASYYDLFVFPYLRFRVDQPSRGREFLSQVNYRITRKIRSFLRYKYESKFRNLSTSASSGSYTSPVFEEQILEEDYTIIPTLPYQRNQIIFNLDHKTSNTVTLKSRAQYSNFIQNGVTSQGFYISQDVRLNIQKFRITCRYALFDTEDGNNRQYVFEPEVLYAYPLKSFSGKGSRAMVVFRYKASRKLNFYFKIGRTYYAYTPGYTISSGNNQIDGNIRTDAKVQVRIKL